MERIKRILANLHWTPELRNHGDLGLREGCEDVPGKQ